MSAFVTLIEAGISAYIPKMNIGFLSAHKEAERPAASNAEAGTLYSISNTQVLFKETGSLAKSN